MADNITLKNDASSTVGTLAADDISSVLYPRSKITLGADGTNDGDLSKTNGMPVSGNTVANGSGTEARVVVDADGHAQVDVLTSALPSGAATAANQATGNASLATIAGAVAGSEVQVDIVTLPVVNVSDNGGSLTVDAPVGTPVFVRLSDGTNPITNLGVTGSVAHDAVDANNPVKVGAKATTALSGLTLVGNADRTDLYAGVDGVQITRPHCNLEDIVSGVAAITDGSSTSVIGAQGSGIKTYVTEVIIANSSASNVTVDLRDGTGGSVKMTLSAPANGGSHKTLSTPLPFSANTAVAADPSAAASTVTVTLLGFKSKV